MSYRPLYLKLAEATKLGQLLSSKNPMIMRSQLHHNIKMRKPLNNPSMFSLAILKRYWETIPLITITIGGVVCEFIFALRIALTRDDVSYFGKRPYEDYSRIIKNQPPPIRKLIPLFVIVGGAMLGLGFDIVRNGLTRDDVRFYKGAKMNCEDTENFAPRKLLVLNQKYEVPKGLKEALAALQEPTSENDNEAGKKAK